jgi:outer membrane murein-binding lipoprotein Lpp
LDKEADLRLKINELSTKAADRDKQIDDLQSQKKTLKMHKKVLKDEVVRLRKELNESEIRA